MWYGKNVNQMITPAEAENGVNITGLISNQNKLIIH